MIITEDFLKKEYRALKDTMRAKVYNKYGLIREMPIRLLYDNLDKYNNPHAILLDGIITQRLIDRAELHNAKYIFGNISTGTTSKIKLFVQNVADNEIKDE
jgi:hypothetical protein